MKTMGSNKGNDCPELGRFVKFKRRIFQKEYLIRIINKPIDRRRWKRIQSSITLLSEQK
jgi:hypothetical protein